MIVNASEADAGKRLDVFLQEQLPEYSRSRLQDWIKAGRVRVNGAAERPSSRLRGGEAVEVEPAALAPLKAYAEDLPLDVLYQDAEVVAVDKPAGMVVHAGAGPPLRHAGERAARTVSARSPRAAARCGPASSTAWTASPAA